MKIKYLLALLVVEIVVTEVAALATIAAVENKRTTGKVFNKFYSTTLKKVANRIYLDRP
jgi:hypothetical protein